MVVHEAFLANKGTTGLEDGLLPFTHPSEWRPRLVSREKHWPVRCRKCLHKPPHGKAKKSRGPQLAMLYPATMGRYLSDEQHFGSGSGEGLTSGCCFECSLFQV
jgi:hypothetical protein